MFPIRVTWIYRCLSFLLFATCSALCGQSAYEVANGETLPRYYCVTEFYNTSYEAFRVGEDAFEWTILRKLNIPAGSKAAEAVEFAMIRAQAILKEEFTPEDKMSAEGQDRAYTAHRQARIRRLAAVYWSMLARLEPLGIEQASIEEFMDAEIAPHTAIYSTKPGAVLEDDELVALMRAEFEESVKNHGQGGGQP